MDFGVIVAGGGLAGLSAAVALADAGLRVQVLEASDALGGRARSWDDPAIGDRVDIGPHVLMSEYRNMRRLLERLGTSHDVLWQRDPFLTFVDPPHPPVDLHVRRSPPPLHLVPDMLRVRQVGVLDTLSNTRATWRMMRLTPRALAALDHEPADAVLRRLGVRARTHAGAAAAAAGGVGRAGGTRAHAVTDASSTMAPRSGDPCHDPSAPQ